MEKRIITAASVSLAFLRVDVAHITQFNPMLHVCANSAHTFLQQSRTCSFSWNQIEAPYILVPLTSAKQKCKTFPSCLIFINSSSIIITDEQLGSLTAAHSRQPLLVSLVRIAMACGCACHALSSDAEQLYSVLVATTKWTCYYECCIFVGQWYYL